MKRLVAILVVFAIMGGLAFAHEEAEMPRELEELVEEATNAARAVTAYIIVSLVLSGVTLLLSVLVGGLSAIG